MKPMKMKLASSVFVVLLVATACSRTNDVFATALSDSSFDVTQAAVAEATDFIVRKWGDEGGFVIVVLASDRGYTIDQLLRGFERLNEDGTLIGEGPRLQPLGLVSQDPGPTASGGDEEGSLQAGIQLIALAQEPGPDPSPYLAFVDQTLAEIWMSTVVHPPETATSTTAPRPDESATETTDDAVVAAFLGLSARGYTPRQIIESMVLRTVQVDVPASPDSIDILCFSIKDESPDGSDLLASECHEVLGPLFAPDKGDSGDSPIEPPGTTPATTPLPAPPVSAEGSTSVYRGVFEPFFPNNRHPDDRSFDEEVFVNFVEVTFVDGVVDSVSGEYSSNIVQESFEVVFCRADLRFSIRSTATSPLIDGQAEVPTEWTTVQGVPVLQPGRTNHECDAEGSTSSASVNSRITVDGDVAVLQFLSKGQVVSSVTLTR